ncbi:MAG: NUDIX hydrolase [Acidimicrobiia bacterium]|nr:NUDIX hydrolase [Acidimicrobiia bacterium]
MSLKPHRVKAAGGVVVRGGVDGHLEVLLVHRPAYGDWTFPKGKSERGERWRETAHREVLEETGFDCELGSKIGMVRYLDGKQRHKEVRYWVMTVVSGDFAPNDEVDGIRWCSIEEAGRALTYDHDRRLLDSVPTLVGT